MAEETYDPIRADIGAVAAAIGCFGVLFFILALPLSHFFARFYVGLGFREGVQPTAEVLEEAVSTDYRHVVFYRLVPMLLFSLLLIAYGFYEGCVEQQRKSRE